LAVLFQEKQSLQIFFGKKCGDGMVSTVRGIPKPYIVAIGQKPERPEGLLLFNFREALVKVLLTYSAKVAKKPRNKTGFAVKKEILTGINSNQSRLKHFNYHQPVLIRIDEY
jgi:hypothetical protein